jgi:hypothetical protein
MSRSTGHDLSSWDDHTRVLALALFVPVAAFAAAAWFGIASLRTEVRLGRAFVAATFAGAAALAALSAMQLHFDVEQGLAARGNVPLVAPHLWLLRPAAGLAAAGVGACANTHHAFRWATIVAVLALTGLEVAVASDLAVSSACLSAGTCVTTLPGAPAPAAVATLLPRAYAAVAVGVWLALSVTVVNSVMGPCGPRYPVQLFALARLDAITHKARGTRVDGDADEAGAPTRLTKGPRAGGELKARIQATGRVVWGAARTYINDILSGK